TGGRNEKQGERSVARLARVSRGQARVVRDPPPVRREGSEDALADEQSGMRSVHARNPQRLRALAEVLRVDEEATAGRPRAHPSAGRPDSGGDQQDRDASHHSESSFGSTAKSPQRKLTGLFAATRLGGFEPPTRGLEGRRSSTELQAPRRSVAPA